MTKKAPTIRDVAKKAGVSVATVSRVMNNKGYLSDTIKKQVQAAMDELGYVPNQIARSFFKKKTNSIGVIIPTITNPFFGELVYHIERYAEEMGIKVFLCNSLDDPAIEKRYLNMLLENQVDGIIVGAHNEELDEYATPNIPIVAVERFLANKRIATVCSDNYEGGRLATEYLLEKGCRQLICFAGKFRENYPANDRRVAFEERAGAACVPHQIMDVNSFDRRAMEEVIAKNLSAHPEIDGIFATDDVIATAVMRVLQEQGKQVHQEVQLIGFDGTEMLRGLFPDLVTVCQPIDQLAKYAVSSLHALIQGEQIPKMIVLPVSLWNV